MKLGNIFKKEEKEEELNPRSLSGKMGLRFNRPAVPGGNRTGGATFVPDYRWDTPYSPTGGITCPSTGNIYNIYSGMQVRGINVPIRLLISTPVLQNSQTLYGFCEIYYKISSSPIGNSVSPILPSGYTLINPLFFTGNTYSNYIQFDPTLITINPNEYISIAYKIIQPWTENSTKILYISNTEPYFYAGALMQSTIQAIIYPLGCTWAPADSTPNPTPNFNNTSGSYS